MNAFDILMYGHKTVLSTLDAFPKEEISTPGACGYWSAKDLTAHLGSFEVMLAELLDSLLDHKPAPLVDQYKANGQAFNDEQVDHLRKDSSFEEVLAEYMAAHERVRASAKRVLEITWEQENLLPWYGAQYDLEDFIVYTFYGHKREHTGQIQVWRDKFKK